MTASAAIRPPAFHRGGGLNLRLVPDRRQRLTGVT
jgi:hypothetical protein